MIPKRLRPSVTCKDFEFMCHNGHECINKHFVCDGSTDCRDHSDELNCSAQIECNEDQFQCQNSVCIPKEFRCNRAYECIDESDEEGCVSPVTNKDGAIVKTCSADQFLCSNGKCISGPEVCDGFNTCGDWSDEPTACHVNECKANKHTCSDICVDDRIGYHCECQPGFKLDPTDNQTCVDVDECQEDSGLCSGHICINLKGHYKCECNGGYVLKDHKYCKINTPERPTLLFTNRHNIRSIDLPSNNATKVKTSPKARRYAPLYEMLSSATAFDYNIKNNYIVWSDVVEEAINIAPLDPTKPMAGYGMAREFDLTTNGTHSTVRNGSHVQATPRVLIEHGSVSNDGLAVDWIHNLIYWTDTHHNTIEVANVSKPSDRTILFNTQLDEPRAIAINIMESFIVWTDWGEHPKIERASADGSDRKLLVDQNIIWPNGVTIDLIIRRIYWIDAKEHGLYSMNYDGKDRRTILKSAIAIRHPFNIDVFEDWVYFTDWETESLKRVDKFGRNSTANTLLDSVNGIVATRVLHSYKQPHIVQSHCLEAKCSHLCLPKPYAGQHRCACPTGMVLLSDQTTCELMVTPPAATAPGSAPKSSHKFAVPIFPHGDDSALNKLGSEVRFRPQNPTVVETESDGHLALYVGGLLTLVVLIVALIGLFYRRLALRRSLAASLNFDNPVYRKTTTRDTEADADDHISFDHTIKDEALEAHPYFEHSVSSTSLNKS